jgi:diguanylate cyclase (GGDEF)-like protein/PAS domain S-box-containing protein
VPENATEIDQALSVSLAYRRFRRRMMLSLAGTALLASVAIGWQLGAAGINRQIADHVVFGVMATLLLVAIVVFSSYLTLKAYQTAEARQLRYRKLYKLSLSTEEKLRDSQRHLHLIADNLPVVIGYTDREERIRFANRTYGVLFDDVPDDITGMWIADVIGHDTYQLSKPYIDAALRGEMVRFERSRTTRSGARIDSVTYIPDNKDGVVAGFFLLVEDITQRKREEEMRKLQALVYENTSEGMMILESNGAIINVNPAFTELTGFTLDEVRGKHLSAIASEKNDPEFFDMIRRAIGKTGRWQGEIWNRHKNGENYLISIKFNTVFDEAGKAWRRVALFADVTEKKANEEKIWRQANFDPLTSLPNRRMFHEHLRTEMKKSERTHALLGIVFVDLDYFKEVNDSLGHACGDMLLKETAQRLIDCVRGSDLVARLGGDEFILLLGELADIGDAARIAEEIRDRLAEPFFLGTNKAHISASIGIAFYPADGKTIDALLKNADRAMYAAKNQGRNRYHMWITH